MNISHVTLGFCLQISVRDPSICLTFRQCNLIYIPAVSPHWKSYLLRSLPTTQLPAALHTSLDFSLLTPRSPLQSEPPSQRLKCTHPRHAELLLAIAGRLVAASCPYPKPELTQSTVANTLISTS